jgi:hypothetical protein
MGDIAELRDQANAAEAEAMGEILFTCPQTLQSVPTGLKAEWVCGG